jgi:hypothetical protein
MQIGAIKANAIKEVIEMYPQDCLGCAIYNIVKWSYVLKQ